VHGFLNLNKSSGFTSHDCVARVRKLLNQKRVGHAGTLDPAATGVLPIALGKATRLLQFLPQDKAYRATIRFGVTTTTDDLEGEVVQTTVASGLTLEAVKQVLPQFLGNIQQIPPNYSAVQVGGKRLYDLARQGQEITVAARSVQVYRIEVLDWRSGELPELDVTIACGPGTYIRAIARDLGKALTTGGTLATLLRTESSGFCLQNSLTLEQLEGQIAAGTFQPVPPETALDHLEAIALPPDLAHRWCQGQRILLPQEFTSWQPSSATLRVHHCDGAFLGIGQVANNPNGLVLSPTIVFE
jgi:tRNA pseudouridine55 synthase